MCMYVCVSVWERECETERWKEKKLTSIYIFAKEQINYKFVKIHMLIILVVQSFLIDYLTQLSLLSSTSNIKTLVRYSSLKKIPACTFCF